MNGKCQGCIFPSLPTYIVQHHLNIVFARYEHLYAGDRTTLGQNGRLERQAWQIDRVSPGLARQMTLLTSLSSPLRTVGCNDYRKYTTTVLGFNELQARAY